MKVMVIYDPAGEILAILQHAPAPKTAGVKATFGIDPGPGQLVAECELEGEMAKKPLSEIHQACCIDVKAKKLVHRAS